jgi:DnaJ-class molecular chaperone
MKERYNYILKRNIKLAPGEYFCPKCNGKGIIQLKNKKINLECSKCYGYGKLDWVEKAMGKRLIHTKEWAADRLASTMKNEIDNEILNKLKN